jgi:hypothetical protein
LAAVLFVAGAGADVPAIEPERDEVVGAAAGAFDGVVEPLQATSASIATVASGVRNLIR